MMNPRSASISYTYSAPPQKSSDLLEALCQDLTMAEVSGAVVQVNIVSSEFLSLAKTRIMLAIQNGKSLDIDCGGCFHSTDPGGSISGPNSKNLSELIPHVELQIHELTDLIESAVGGISSLSASTNSDISKIRSLLRIVDAALSDQQSIIGLPTEALQNWEESLSRFVRHSSDSSLDLQISDDRAGVWLKLSRLAKQILEKVVSIKEYRTEWVSLEFPLFFQEEGNGVQQTS